MFHPYRTLSLLLLILMLAACGGQVADNTDVTGTWTGQISGSGGTAPLTLQLTQSSSTVSGTLELGGDQLEVSGVLAGNLISLSGQDQTGTLQLEGSVSSTMMQGTITVNSQGQNASVTFSATKGQ